MPKISDGIGTPPHPKSIIARTSAATSQRCHHPHQRFTHRLYAYATATPHHRRHGWHEPYEMETSPFPGPMGRMRAVRLVAQQPQPFSSRFHGKDGSRYVKGAHLTGYGHRLRRARMCILCPPLAAVQVDAPSVGARVRLARNGRHEYDALPLQQFALPSRAAERKPRGQRSVTEHHAMAWNHTGLGVDMQREPDEPGVARPAGERRHLPVGGHAARGDAFDHLVDAGVERAFAFSGPTPGGIVPYGIALCVVLPRSAVPDTVFPGVVPLITTHPDTPLSMTSILHGPRTMVRLGATYLGCIDFHNAMFDDIPSRNRPRVVFGFCARWVGAAPGTLVLVVRRPAWTCRGIGVRPTGRR